MTDQLQTQGPENPSLAKIREQYKICALKYHPDKCKLYDANERFREVHDAYEYLKEYSNPEPNPKYNSKYTYDSFGDDEDGYSSYDDDDEQTPDYKKMIGAFLSKFIRNIWFEDGDKSLQHKLAKLVITKILGLCEKKATEYVRRLDAKTLSNIYEILLKYQDAFHLSASWMETVAEILSEKINGETSILLNPFLEDLQLDNLYKITENGKTYIVPLWHPELVYDSGENTCVDFTVRCCPVLPDHMEIDEHNNVIVKLQYSMKDLWERETNTQIEVPFGKTVVSFLPSSLRLSRKPQTIRLVEQGISRINQTDMFDNTKRADVVLVITIT